MSSYIYLVRLGEVDGRLLEFAVRCIEETFDVSCKISSKKLNIDDAYDSVRNQYHSAKLLGDLIENPPADALKVFGLTEVDLFLPIFTYLFGEAQLNGIGGLLSIHRLHNRFYGLPEDRRLFESRVEKEIIHELGHMFGLIHCFDPVCVMNASTYVEDIDQKADSFCANCLDRLSRHMKKQKNTPRGWGVFRSLITKK